MTTNDRESILEEEILILRNSGEIPEIALYTSLYYLEEDEEGPQLSLHDGELYLLYDAAIARAREIVLRDLDPANRDLSLYRGPTRSIVNWYRLQNLCRRIGMECQGFKEKVSHAFLFYMEREFTDTQQELRISSVNCTAEEIRLFCEQLCIDMDSLPDGWTCLCRE